LLCFKKFEKILIGKLNTYLISSDLQFAFKSNAGCRDAILTARTIADYYTKRGSTVNVCALDLSTAFDNVIFSKLFLTLMNRMVPRVFISILNYWYINCSVTVRWNNTFSRSFNVISGVRQGGILSPALFAVYMDVLIIKLQTCRYGCCIDGHFMGCLMYADDILLLSNSLNGLQGMLDVCHSVFTELGMTLNVKKSAILRCGNRHNTVCADVCYDGVIINYVTKLTYLGITFLSGKTLMIDFYDRKSAFYRSFNMIYSRSKSAESETISISLMKSICIPTLLYAIEALSPNKSTINSLDNIINRCVGRIFNTYDINILADGREHLNVSDITTSYYVRFCRFLLTIASNKYWFAEHILRFAYDNLALTLRGDRSRLLKDQPKETIIAVLKYFNS
jgi:hypothetical protein